MNDAQSLMQQLAMQTIEKSPQVAQNPRYQGMIEAIRTNNSQRGIELADNYCRSMGITREQAIQQASNWLQGQMQNTFGGRH